MRLLLALALMASICLFFVPASASDAGTEPSAAGPVPEWVTDDAAPEATDAVAPEPGSNADLLQKYKEVKAAYDAIKDADPDISKKLLYFFLLAAMCNFLISVIKRVGKLTSRGKKYLPWAAAGLGVVVGFASHYAFGAGVFAAVWYGAGPPFAVVVQELLGKPADKLLSLVTAPKA